VPVVTIGVALMAGRGAAETAVQPDRNAAPKARNVTFYDLKFEISVGQPFLRSMLGQKIERLDGAVIRIRGFMYPHVQQKGITQFILVRDNEECCFGPKAALYDCISVDMVPGKSTSYTLRPIAVQGRFEIREYKGPDGKHLAIYRLVAEEVK
jgi:hypothetical protein